MDNIAKKGRYLLEKKDLSRKVFGNYLRARRKELNLSLEEAGFQAGVDHNNLSRVERGEQYANANTLFKLEPVLQMNISQIFQEIREKGEN